MKHQEKERDLQTNEKNERRRDPKEKDSKEGS